MAHLLDVMEIKGLCRQAGIQQIDAGPKGAVLQFRKNLFANPQELAKLITAKNSPFKLQPDHKLVFRADWEKPEDRLKGVRALAEKLAGLAGAVRDGAG